MELEIAGFFAVSSSKVDYFDCNIICFRIEVDNVWDMDLYRPVRSSRANLMTRN